MTKKIRKDCVMGLLLPAIYLVGLTMTPSLLWAKDILGGSGGNAEDKAYKRNGTLLFSCCGGTLGALVQDVNGNQHILSNNHVLALSNRASIGDAIITPGLIDTSPVCDETVATEVATLSDFIEISDTVTNNVDAAIAQVIGSISQDITGIGAVNGVYSDVIMPGTAVMKQGRTTGLTYGMVDMVNVSVSVKYGEECGSNKGFIADFENQIYVIGADFSAGGDSGSVVLTTQPDTNGDGNFDVAGVEAVGLLFAGDDSGTVLNPIGKVLSQLNVTLVTGTNDKVFMADSSSGGGGSKGGPPEGKGPPGSRGKAVFGLEHASAVKDVHALELMSLPNVVAVGVGVDDNGKAVIKINLESAAVNSSIPIPTEIDGIPVHTRFTGPVVAY